jgi:general secretion pathway protein H
MAARGFTLLELLVVIAIIAILLAAIPGFVLRDTSSVEVRSAARTLADGLRETRSRALVANRPQAFAIDLEGRRFRPGEGRPLKQLERDLELSLTTARTLVSESVGSGTIRFFPDGSSTGGRIGVARGDTRAFVSVDWLTGDVRIEDASR